MAVEHDIIGALAVAAGVILGLQTLRSLRLPAAQTVTVHETVFGSLATALLALLVPVAVNMPALSPGAFTAWLAWVVLGSTVVLVSEQSVRMRDAVFGICVGTIVAVIAERVVHGVLLSPDGPDAYTVALAVPAVLVLWRTLYGPWSVHSRMSVLLTFLLWISLWRLGLDSPDVRGARLVAAVVALIPAVLWCIFFLREHRERIATVVLMVCAGMLSTVPVLFYDLLATQGLEMQFFFFRIVPENFSRTSGALVSGSVGDVPAMTATLVSTFVAFILVAFIEEVSKGWVLYRAGSSLVTSIDDALQFGILVAIGFSFAENIINPTYFLSFVQQYLLSGDIAWGGFFSNVFGRGILTTMVHVTCTGIVGYSIGRAIFAQPWIEDHKGRWGIVPVCRWLAEGLRMPLIPVVQIVLVLLGFVTAVGLHACFNFLVTFPQMLPSNPQSLGDLPMLRDIPVIRGIPILLVPCLFYIVGGCWLLTELFSSRDNEKEYGHPETQHVFIPVTAE